MTEFEEKRLENALKDLVVVKYDEDNLRFIASVSEENFLSVVDMIFPFNAVRWGTMKKFPKHMATITSCDDERKAKENYIKVLIKYVEYVITLASVGHEL